MTKTRKTTQIPRDLGAELLQSVKRNEGAQERSCDTCECVMDCELRLKTKLTQAAFAKLLAAC